MWAGRCRRRCCASATGARTVARALGVPGGILGLIGPSVNYMAFGDGMRLAGAPVTAHAVNRGPVDDLAFAFLDVGVGRRLVVEAEADVARYSADDVDGHLRRVVAVLDALVADAAAGRSDRSDRSGRSGRPLAALDLLGDERRQVEAGERAWAPAASPQTLPGGFEAQVDRTPAAVAVVDGDRDLTYGELDAWANRLARVLAARGVGRGDVVAVALPRTAEAVAAVLAVGKAGAAHLPLDPDLPGRAAGGDGGGRRPGAGRHDLGRRRAAAGCRGRFLAAGRRPGRRRRGGGGGLGTLGPGRGPELLDAAYVIFTSGSTGRPKGVVATHEGITSLVATAVGAWGVGPGDRVLQFASVGFDVAVFELAMTLHTGAALVVTPGELRTAGPPLLEFVRRQRVTVFAFPPSLVAALGEGAELPAGATLLTGSEAVPAEVVARWSKELRVVACYGLTEATVNSMLWWPGPRLGRRLGAAGLGRPGHPGARARRRPGALPARRGRRAVRGRRRPGPRLPGPARRSPPSGSWPTRSRPPPAPACTAPATSWPGGPTARWPSGAGPTSR